MTYKDFPKVYIGDSDIAALVLVGPTADGMKTALLDFGEDNAYQAYIVEGEDVEIGSHYHLDSEWENWLSVYDDAERTYRVHADHIRVYRAGEMGCIIQHWNDADAVKPVAPDTMKIQFEAGPSGNILAGESDSLRVFCEIEVPEDASEDYGYLTMKAAILAELTEEERKAVSFWYDGQEQYLAEDAAAGEISDLRIERF